MQGFDCRGYVGTLGGSGGRSETQYEGFCRLICHQQGVIALRADAPGVLVVRGELIACQGDRGVAERADLVRGRGGLHDVLLLGVYFCTVSREQQGASGSRATGEGLPRACGELNACRSERLTPWDPRNHGMQTRFDVALAMASQAPAGLIRTGAENSVEVALRLTLTHPVTVVTLVQRFGGTEDQVVAALLHDVLEEEGGAGVV